jgi:hypothetical protein
MPEPLDPRRFAASPRERIGARPSLDRGWALFDGIEAAIG